LKNIAIDAALRKAFELGEEYRIEHDLGNLSEAHDAWGKFEKHIAEVMLEENGDVVMIDEEEQRRARYG
jgi:hypothetical protein